MVRVRTFGTVEIDAGNVRIGPGSPRKFALLLRLTADSGHRVPRSVLRELIFPDLLAKNASHSLRDMVYQLRRTGLTIESDADGVALLDSASSDYGDLITSPQVSIEQLRMVQNGFLPAYS